MEHSEYRFKKGDTIVCINDTDNKGDRIEGFHHNGIYMSWVVTYPIIS